MDSDDPDLEAFKSNPCRILRERELGKAARITPSIDWHIEQRQCLTQFQEKDSKRMSMPA